MALVALPGETIVAWSCLLVTVLRADIYIESGTYLQSILKGAQSVSHRYNTGMASQFVVSSASSSISSALRVALMSLSFMRPWELQPNEEFVDAM